MTIRIVAVASTLQSCREGDSQPSRLGDTGRCNLSGALDLAPSAIVPFNQAEAPEAVAANVEHAVVVHSGGRRLSVAPLDGGEVKTTAVSLEADISAIARTPSGFVVAEKAKLYAFDQSDLSLRAMPGAIARGSVQAVAATDEVLWVVSQLGSSWWLSAFYFDQGDQRYTKAHEIALDAEAKLHAYGNDKVLVTQVRYPYTVSVYDNTLRVRHRFSIARHRSFREMLRDSEVTMSLQAMPLDCNRLLQPFVDVVSGTRLLAVVDLTGDGVLRLTSLDIPVGLSQALADAPILVGAVEQPDARSVVAYRWSWDSSAVHFPARP